jgi:hypothetical protein
MEVHEADLKDRHKYLLPWGVQTSGYGGAERKFISERNFDVLTPPLLTSFTDEPGALGKELNA